MNLWPEYRARAANRLLSWLLLILWAASVAACSPFSTILSKPRPPAAMITTPTGGSIAQTGSAETPAALSSDVTEIEIPVSAFGATPAASSIAAAPVVPSSPVRITTSHNAATAPRSFAPPAPPSAAETARAAVFKWFCLAALIGLLVAGLLAWAQHYLAAVKVAAGAIALPVLGHFFSSAVAIPVATGLVCLGGGLFVAWHILAARHPEILPALSR